MANKRHNKHHCSSCDAYVDIDEMDGCGRCEKCQHEYPFDEEIDEEIPERDEDQ